MNSITQHIDEGYWQRWPLNDAKKAIDLALAVVSGEHTEIMRRKFGQPSVRERRVCGTSDMSTCFGKVSSSGLSLLNTASRSRITWGISLVVELIPSQAPLAQRFSQYVAPVGHKAPTIPRPVISFGVFKL